MINYYISEA
jgi:hypothetical protein